jgi:hypothetical protein
MPRILRTLLVFVLLAAAGFAQAPDFAETKKEADAGKAYAQYNLGVMYANGRGVLKVANEAAKWFHKAAVQGHAQAQADLGFMYYKGEGVPKDLVFAHVWLNIAGANGNENAKKNLAIAEKEMTESQKEKAMELARELFAKLPKGE